MTTPKPLFQNSFILKKPEVANFADIIKITGTFIKPTLKNPTELKIIKNYELKRNLHLYFLI